MNYLAPLTNGYEINIKFKILDLAKLERYMKHAEWIKKEFANPIKIEIITRTKSFTIEEL